VDVTEQQERTAEGRLITAARKAKGMSARAVAREAGISESRLRQIVTGYQTVSGQRVPVDAPASTIARVAAVLGIAPSQLTEAGRSDAAIQLVKLQDDEMLDDGPDGLGDDEEQSASEPPAEGGQRSGEVRGVGGNVIDLPLPVRLELAEREVLDYRIVDLTRPGSDHRMIVLWTGEPPEDLDDARRDMEAWSRRIRAVEGVSDDDETPPQAGNGP
jgi:transcriptional regulator with XRE-family HTH domain